METLTHCPLCQTALTGTLYIQARDHLVTGDMFNIEQCQACDFLFTNPRPGINDISQYYQSAEYISHTDRRNGVQDMLYQKIKQLMLKKKLKLLKKHTTAGEGTILDYGCGTGDFVLAAANEGYNSVGYEPEPKARDKAKQKGVEVLDNHNTLFKNHTNGYDVITLWHVLEHLHSLQKKMRDFFKLLKPKGWLIIGAPMANSADAIIYKEHWAAYDLPRHLYHFSPETLNRLCNSNGFKITQRKGMFFDSFYISLLSERYKNNAAAPVCAILRGLESNIKAASSAAPWSSEIFFCRKEG